MTTELKVVSFFPILDCRVKYFLDDVEARPRCSYDVTVRFLLDELHRLLLLKDQEAVEFGSCLLPVVVAAQIQ